MEQKTVEFHHNRTKAVGIIRVAAVEKGNVEKLCRFIEIQLNKHGWYQR